jgi:hypothetical protein
MLADEEEGMTEASVTTSITGEEVLDGLARSVGSWSGVETAEHRFGGAEFVVGRRELGHVHVGGPGRSFADLPFPRAVRDKLIEDGRARTHHVLPDSGWVTFPIRTAADLRDAIELFRMNYDRSWL